MERAEIKKLILDGQVEIYEKLDGLAEGFHKKMEDGEAKWVKHIQKLYEINSMVLFQFAALTEALVEKELLSDEDIIKKIEVLANRAKADGADIQPIQDLVKSVKSTQDLQNNEV